MTLPDTLDTHLLIGSPDTLALDGALLRRTLNAAHALAPDEDALLIQDPRGWTLQGREVTALGGNGSLNGNTVIRAALPAGRIHHSRHFNRMVLMILLSLLGLINILTPGQGRTGVNLIAIAFSLLTITLSGLAMWQLGEVYRRGREQAMRAALWLTPVAITLLAIKIALLGNFSPLSGVWSGLILAVSLATFARVRRMPGAPLIPVELTVDTPPETPVRVHLQGDTVHLQTGHAPLNTAQLPADEVPGLPGLHPALSAALAPLLTQTDEQGRRALERASEELRVLSQGHGLHSGSQAHYLVTRAQQRAAEQIQDTDPQTAISILGLALNEARLLSRPAPTRPGALEEARHYYAQTTPDIPALDSPAPDTPHSPSETRDE